MENAVLVATGADRPGVMDELSQFLLECGGNITDSRSVNLRGQFALLLLIRGEQAAMETIRSGLAAFAARDLIAQLRPADGTVHGEAPAFPFVFTASGTDQAGVLHRLSHLLRVLNVNIDDIETHVEPDGLFQIRLELSVPRPIPVSMLREYLEVLCKELNMRGELKEA